MKRTTTKPRSRRGAGPFTLAQALRRGRIDEARVDAMSEADIMRTSPPELADLPDDFFDNAVRVPPVKRPVSLRLDADVLAYFREQPRYQTQINAVLRAYVDHRLRTRAAKTASQGHARPKMAAK